jgi:hypothetical protein
LLSSEKGFAKGPGSRNHLSKAWLPGPAADFRNKRISHVSARAVTRDQTHRELVYRPLQFQKCGQLVIGANDETLSVAKRGSNPDCAALCESAYTWPSVFRWSLLLRRICLFNW